MDVAKVQQNTEEDPEFVRQRRAAIDTLITSQVSKTQRFAQQDVMKATNVAKGFAEASRRVPVERPNSAGSSATASASYPSSTAKPTDMAATAAAIKANSRSSCFILPSSRCISSLHFQYRNGRRIRFLMNRWRILKSDLSPIVNRAPDVTSMMMTTTTGPDEEVEAVSVGVDEAEADEVETMTVAQKHVRARMSLSSIFSNPNPNVRMQQCHFD